MEKIYEVNKPKRKERIYEYKIDDSCPHEHTRVCVYYSLGGTNYVDGSQIERGYYLSIMPATYDQKSGFVQTTMFGDWSGLKSLIKSTNRFSKKDFDNIEIPEIEDAKAKVLIDAIVAENN